jgi:glycosyltransferase involved in cell wall biosynthesis
MGAPTVPEMMTPAIAESGSLPVIGMVLHKPFPPDPRVAREAKALIEAGYRVILLCAGRPGEPATETIDGIDVVRVFLAEEFYGEGKKQPKKTWRVGFSVRPYNSNLKRLLIHLGSAQAGLKIPRLKCNHRYTDPQTGDRVRLFGPFQWKQPKAWGSSLAWLRANRDFWGYLDQSQFIDPVWCAQILDFVQRYGIEVLHIHDLLLVYSGLIVSEAEGIPLVADLHENWPALMDINRAKFRQLYERRAKMGLFKGYFEERTNGKKRWEAHEQVCCRRADHILVVADAAKARLVETGVPAEKLSVVTNTIDIDAFLAKPVDQAVLDHYKDRFVVSYVGGFGPHRGIDTLLRAAAVLKVEIPELWLYLAGSDSPTSDHYLTYCKTLAQELGVADITDFTGWADDAAYRTYTALSDVGVIPHKANEHTQTTMPNKIYNYMLLEKPILCSDLAPLQAVVDETGSGLCFKADDHEDLAAQLRTLYRDPELRARLGKAGREGVYRKFNWQATAETLVRVYQDLGKRLTSVK